MILAFKQYPQNGLYQHCGHCVVSSLVCMINVDRDAFVFEVSQYCPGPASPVEAWLDTRLVPPSL